MYKCISCVIRPWHLCASQKLAAEVVKAALPKDLTRLVTGSFMAPDSRVYDDEHEQYSEIVSPGFYFELRQAQTFLF